MVKPKNVPDLLKILPTAKPAPKEPSPKERLTEREQIRPARTGIAHARGGNKGK